MARYRLVPAPEQEAVLRMHCAHARFVWNLAVEQESWWRPGRSWLRNGSQTVQQQALRDFGQAMQRFFTGTHHRPSFRKAGRHEGFRIVALKPEHVHRLLKARDADGRKDWAEKLSTGLARRFDVICVEDLRIRNMMRSARGTVAEPGKNVSQKTGLNREIARSGWGLLVSRLEDKAPGRVEKVNPAYTSQRCSACGHVAAESRESQSRFRCVACGFAANADVNAALNIAAGHAVTARGADRTAGAMMREPQAA